ncbi:MBL fold metallo-hydrolase [Lyngbya sp. CCY1209]|uniref:MBL fold metallo-hydrolase n=1 Tax=Lyngbya sp. CCY1209 TaxID=2886103 RepID=UPI0035C9384F
MSVSDPPARNPQISNENTMNDNSSSPEFCVQFWGVRGSVPTPGRQTIRYGGNTSCVEMRLGNQRLIFDGGTGLRVLGLDLLKQMPVEARVFFSHTHWDHIQGFPFFVPAFIPINRFHIYGAIAPDGTTIKERLSDQMVHPNFPVPMHVMQSDMKFYDIVPGDAIALDGGIKIETAPLNHPNVAIGYRVTWEGRTAVYCSDTEHFLDRFDENVLHLARDADLLIYDATYTNEEYHDRESPKLGWGHSTWEVGVEVAKKAGVKQVVMYQHDPSHDDDFLDAIETQVQAHFPSGMVAREGMILTLD